MVPGKVYAITIELFPIANLFCRGHRLRLSSRASPATGSSPRQPAPSHVLLPVIPPGE
jgi:predicted acyl esterase